MSDVIDVMYRFRNMASIAADKLRIEIEAAQAVLDKLDRFADDAEDAAQLVASSGIAPTHHADPPKRAGLTRTTLTPTEQENRP